MILFKFLFATFLFKNGFRSANKIGQAVNVSPPRLFQWSETPLWRLALRLWGHSGTIKLKNFARYRQRQNAGNIKALHIKRMNRAKEALLNKNAQQHKSKSLKLAEKLWVDVFSGDGAFAEKILNSPAEVPHDTE